MTIFAGFTGGGCRCPLGCDQTVPQNSDAGEKGINQQIALEQRSSAQAQPRAFGTAVLSVVSDPAGTTRIRTLRQSGSMKLAFPQTHRKDVEAIMVNTAGGITGGDRFSTQAHVEAGASLSLTTQAAERVYRAQAGEIGQVTTSLKVEAGGRLNWLPQELILFDRSALNRSLEITLAPKARLLMVEPVVFGRAAMNEQLHDVRIQDRIRIHRAGQPLYIDGMTLSGDAAAHLARRAIANGAGAMASLVYVAPDAAQHLSAIRALLPASAGASMIADDVLVLRQLAVDSLELRRVLIPVLDRLTHNTLPTSWRL